VHILHHIVYSHNNYGH